MAADPHGWASWQEYLNAHNGKLDGLRDHFIIEDRLQPVLTTSLVFWNGELLCVDGITVTVDRTQNSRIRHNLRQVRTRDYVYNVTHRIGSETRKIVRYDNIGDHGHLDKHHRHAYAANGIETVEWVGKDGWPNLGQVLDEVYDYWQRWKGGDVEVSPR